MTQWKRVDWTFEQYPTWRQVIYRLETELNLEIRKINYMFNEYKKLLA